MIGRDVASAVRIPNAALVGTQAAAAAAAAGDRVVADALVELSQSGVVVQFSAPAQSLKIMGTFTAMETTPVPTAAAGAVAAAAALARNVRLG